jgi:transposase-like protein
MAREENGPTKAMVLAELATGDSISAVAKRHNINKGTVSRWNREAAAFVPTAPGAMVAVVAQPDATQKTRAREAVEGRLYDYMLSSIDTLAAQIRLFGNDEWLRKQPAGDLGNLHGIVADKTARLLAAFQRGIDAADTED